MEFKELQAKQYHLYKEKLPSSTKAADETQSLQVKPLDSDPSNEPEAVLEAKLEKPAPPPNPDSILAPLSESPNKLVTRVTCLLA